MLGKHFDGDGAVETSVFRFVHFAHPAGAERREDFIGAESSSGSYRHRQIAIFANLRAGLIEFQLIVQAPGIEDDVETGTYEIQGEFILVEPDDAPGDTIHFAYQFQETKTVLSLTLATDDLDFDFAGDGSEEPAILFAVVIR